VVLYSIPEVHGKQGALEQISQAISFMLSAIDDNNLGS
jgi:hypothetical protein